MKKTDLPYHTQISLGELTDLHHHFDYSMLLAEQITTISKSQLRNYVGKVDDADAMRRINTIINRQLGGVGHIGGGAMSGKDPSKVDRSGAYMARKIARDIVLAGYADKAEVQIAYAIGVAEPVSVYVETFDTEHQDKRFIEQYVLENYDLTPKGVIEGLHLLDVDYNKVSAYGHFGGKSVPWEE